MAKCVQMPPFDPLLVDAAQCLPVGNSMSCCQPQSTKHTLQKFVHCSPSVVPSGGHGLTVEAGGS